MSSVPNDNNKTIRTIFARNLCYYLEKGSCSQAALSKHLNVSSAAVSMWCSGKKIPRMDKIESICRLLHIQKSDLLEDKPENERNIDPEILKDAQQQALFLMHHPEYRLAFYYLMNTSSEDLPLVTSFLRRISNTNTAAAISENNTLNDSSDDPGHLI